MSAILQVARGTGQVEVLTFDFDEPVRLDRLSVRGACRVERITAGPTVICGAPGFDVLGALGPDGLGEVVSGVPVPGGSVQVSLRAEVDVRVELVLSAAPAR